MSVVFTSFFCPKLDVDLLPFWVKHYIEYFFDRYAVIMHRVDGDDEQAEQAKMILHDAGFETGEVYGMYNNGELQEHYLKRFRDTLDKDDRQVIADSDEFHQMPFSYRELAKEYDIIDGSMVECWGDTLHDIMPGVPLHVQYPHSGDIFGAILPNAVGGWKFDPPKTKILSSKVSMPVALNGSHGMYPKPAHGTYTRFPDRLVHHYTCRPGYISRLAGKSYVPLWVITAMAGFFKLSPDCEESKMIARRISERHKLMGWEPSPAPARQ